MQPDPAHSTATAASTAVATAVSTSALRNLRIGGISLIVIALVVVALGILTRTSDAARLRERADAGAIPTVVLITPALLGTAGGSANTLDLPGRLEANSRASIYARVSGYLKSWKVDIGAPVKAGQLLAEIETPDLDQQLLRAQADFANAQANASLAETTNKRWQAMLAADSVSRQEAEEKAGDLTAKRALANAAKANVDNVLAQKGFTRIVAPFDGVVTARSTDVGALINVGSGAGPALFEVSDTRKLRVYASVPQSQAASIRRGAKAKISVPERPGKFYAATVESLSQAVNAASGSMLIQLAVNNAEGELLPGGFANVSLDLPQAGGALNVPPSALLFDKSGISIATVDKDNRVLLKPVTIGRDYGKVVELASGVSATDRVIESPPDGIANGDAVNIAVPSATAATAAPSATKPGSSESAKK